RQWPLVWMVKQIGDVYSPRCFAANNARQPRMRIPERVDREAPEKIEILPAAVVVEIAALSPHKDKRRAPIRVHQVSVGETHRLFRRRAALRGCFADLCQVPTPATAG